MHPSIPHLLDLQDVDHRIAAIRAEIDSFPKKVLEADAKLSTARAAIAAAKEANAASVSERKKLELDAMQWKDRARKYRDQSGAVKTNEAYKALQHEIANAEAETAKAEDAQLEQMMAAEEAEKNVKAAEAVLREAEQSVAADRRGIENHARESNRKMLADIGARDKLAAEIPEEVLTLYARVAKRHHGVALAEAVAEQCRGCGMRMLPHTYQEVYRPESHELHTCENCGRILYAAETASPTAANSPANPTAASAS
jgi:uncharacterized protein